MTPQDLSIADLKAVIDYTAKQLYYPKMKEVYYSCLKEFNERILQLIPPTEPNKEERK